jgi:hypothetical protein
MGAMEGVNWIWWIIIVGIVGAGLLLWVLRLVAKRG